MTSEQDSTKKVTPDLVNSDKKTLEETSTLTAAQRARAERNRLRARALKDARPGPVTSTGAAAHLLDSGGGFLLEPVEPQHQVTPVHANAPLVHHEQQPDCLECGQRFPQSFLLDEFRYNVCDECRSSDNTGDYALMTRTEAKSEFLLKDCDLDSRPPALRFLRRRNPHSSRFGDMRLYLARQVRDRALLVWGSEEALQTERDRRAALRVVGREKKARRELKALRLDVRSSLYSGKRPREAHEHEFGPEQYDTSNDTYAHACIHCGHTETYEKM